MQSHFSRKIEEMSFNEELAIQTLSQICQLGLEPTPDIYSLWYCYFREDNCDLKRKVDTIIDKYDKVEAKHFDSVISTLNMETIALGDFHHNVSSVLGDTFDNAGTIANNVDVLGDYILKTSQSEGVDPQTIIDNIVKKSNNTVDLNHELTERLQEQKKSVLSLQKEYERVCDELITDGLTKVKNRRYLDEKLPRLINEALDADKSLSVIMFDIDHFKKFNDSYGHQVGDTVLKFVGKSMMNIFSDNVDNLFRYGGEEFLVLLPKMGRYETQKYANQLSNVISRKEIILKSSGENIGNITISGGITELTKKDNMESLIERADMALYESKSKGRNCMTVSKI